MKLEVPITYRWEKFVNLISDKTSEKIKKHLKELFGELLLESTNEEHSLLTTLIEKRIPLDEWEDYDIHTKAKILAALRVDSMVETLRRHDEIIKRNTDALLNKNKKPNG